MSQHAIDFMVVPEMSEDELAVWYVIRLHPGATRAIQVDALAAQVRMQPRKVQSIVRALIHDHGKAVGTSMRRPFGYFHAVTSEERVEVADLHRRRALAELATAAKISGIDRAEYIRRFQTELAPE